MKLTKSQFNYILAIKNLAGGQVSQKYVCEYLGVKKSSASIALKNLSENGYIEKQSSADGTEYSLTEKAWDAIKYIDKEKYEFMSLFNGFMGIDEVMCENEYKRLCGDFSIEFIKKLEELRKGKYQFKNSEEGRMDKNKFYGIEKGVYEIPFQVVQRGEKIRSMGDKGFYHPAVLVVESEKQYVLLKAKEIYYKSKNDQILKGKLQELYYYDTDMKWVSSVQEDDNGWIIPLNKILYQKDDLGKIIIGVIKIKAVATTMKMPESEAEITFNFKFINKIDEK